MVTLTTPKTMKDLTAALKDPDTLKQLVRNDKLGEYLDDFAEEQDEVTKQQIEDAQGVGLYQFLRDTVKGGRLPMGGPDDPDGPDAEGEWETGYIQGKQFAAGWGIEAWTKAQVERVGRSRKISETHGFKRPSEFYKSIFHKEMMVNGVDARLKDLSIQIGADGGFLVPEVLRSQLFEVPLESAIVRPRAMVIPMDSLTVIFPTIDDVSHTANVFAGVVANWTEENSTITETQPTFGRVKLEASKLALYTEVPNELFTDSIISLEAFLNRILPEAATYFEDDAFLVGTGAGRPLGVLNASNTALITVTRDTASEVNWDDIVNMYARMLPTSLGSAVWVINQTVFPQLATMALNVGTGGSAVWLSNGVGGPPATILGRPVLITEKVPALGAQGDISFIDFRQYLLGDRQAVTMATSPHFKFQQDQTVFRVTERVDGQPWMRSALTPRNGDTLSPYVTLAA